MDSKDDVDVFRSTSVIGLPRSFFEKPTTLVARELLGKHLAFWSPAGLIAGRIAETEAYHQSEPASHSHRGPTPRNQVMFGQAGHVYVYFIYGMHYCLNIVTEKKGIGSAVLLRGIYPTTGEDLMQANRKGVSRGQWANGPAKLVAAFGLGAASNGVDLCQPDAQLKIVDDGFLPPLIHSGPRIGISKAVDLPWRFWY
ncbi:MAG: DNA-3-methyladenine glycosylase [Candidatus Margulisiibacteriota bacterium]